MAHEQYRWLGMPVSLALSVAANWHKSKYHDPEELQKYLKTTEEYHNITATAASAADVELPQAPLTPDINSSESAGNSTLIKHLQDALSSVSSVSSVSFSDLPKSFIVGGSAVTLLSALIFYRRSWKTAFKDETTQLQADWQKSFEDYQGEILDMLQSKAKDASARQKVLDLERSNMMAAHEAETRFLKTTIEMYAKNEEVLKGQNRAQQEAHEEDRRQMHSQKEINHRFLKTTFLEMIVAASEKNEGELSGQIAQLKSHISWLNSNTADFAARVETNNAALQSFISALLDEQKILKGKTETLSSCNRELIVSNTELKRQLEDISHGEAQHMRDLEQIKAEGQTELDSKDAEISKLQDEVARAKAQHDQNITILEARNAIIATKNQALDKQKGELESIANLKKAVEEKLELTEESLGTHVANNRALQKQVSDDIEYKTSLRKELEDLKLQGKATNSRVAKMQKTLDTSLEATASFHKKFEEVNSELQATITSKASLQKELDQETASTTSLRKKFEDARSDLEVTTTSKAALQKKLDQQTASTTSLRKRFEDARSDLEATTTSKAALQKKLDQQTASTTSLRKELEDARSELEASSHKGPGGDTVRPTTNASSSAGPPKGDINDATRDEARSKADHAGPSGKPSRNDAGAKDNGPPSTSDTEYDETSGPAVPAVSSSSHKARDAQDQDQDDNISDTTPKRKQGKRRRAPRGPGRVTVLEYDERVSHIEQVIRDMTGNGIRFDNIDVPALAGRTEGWVRNLITVAVRHARDFARKEGPSNGNTSGVTTVTELYLKKGVRKVKMDNGLDLSDDEDGLDEERIRTAKDLPGFEPSRRLKMFREYKASAMPREANINWTKLVALTSGFRGGDLQEAMKRAIARTRKRNHESVTQEDLEAAISEVRSHWNIKEESDEAAPNDHREPKDGP